MSYTGPTNIVNVNSASAFLAALDTFILTVAGWSKVSAAIVVGTTTWNVYKCAGATNSFGSDFYVAIGYPTASPTVIRMTIMEGWNTGTLLATNYPPNTAVVPTGVFANPGAALALPSTGTTMGYLESIVMTSSFNYMITVTADRIMFSILNSTNTNIGYYIGLYDTFNTVGVDPFPIVCVSLHPGVSAPPAITTAPANNGMSGFATREPAQAISTTTNFGVATQGSSTGYWTQITASLDAYKGFLYLSRVLLIGRQAAAFRGLLKDCFMTTPNANNLDLITFTIAGVPHTAFRIGASTYGIYADEV